ncbi:MAG: hypothetical protein IPL32_02850 [Chloracidobacterium sp.]|nr:hypothetical protein [Chloracidobacterium sp.]
MSPRSYSFLWLVYFVSVGVMSIAGVLTMVAVVAFGFIAFGLVFMGMMCVLPAAVAHPLQNEEKVPEAVRSLKSKTQMHVKEVRGFSAYKHV